MELKTILATFTLFTACAQVVNAADFELHNRDRVVFYGDSITDNSPYTAFVEAFVVTRYPNLDVRFFNAGVGGDRVSGGWMGPIDKRLPRDLFSRKPTVVTVMLGMNDGSYRPFDQGIFDTFSKGYEHIVSESKKQIPNARFFLIQPSPFDDVTRTPSFPGGYNGVLKLYGDFVSQLARKNGYGVIDLNTPVNTMLTAALSLDSALAPKIIGDRVHPGGSGHLVMAEAILKSWGADGVVSRTEIDSKLGIGHVEHAKIRDIRMGTTLSWQSTEDALPYPVDRNNPETKLVLKASDFDAAMNQEILKVTGLATGSYNLKIDGSNVATFSTDELASGVNLATYNTPMSLQAGVVLNLTTNKTYTQYFKWRQLEVSLASLPATEVSPAIKSYERAEDELIKLQHKLAKPVSHQFELTPQ